MAGVGADFLNKMNESVSFLRIKMENVLEATVALIQQINHE